MKTPLILEKAARQSTCRCGGLPLRRRFPWTKGEVRWSRRTSAEFGKASMISKTEAPRPQASPLPSSSPSNLPQKEHQLVIGSVEACLQHLVVVLKLRVAQLHL